MLATPTEVKWTEEELKEKAFLELMQRKMRIFFIEYLGVHRLEVYHDRILEDFVDFPNLAIAATHAVGKTWITARMALAFLNLYKNSKVITTAPTGRQVKKLLWGEIRAAHRKAIRPLGGRALQTELIINEEWYAMGFSPQKEAGDGREQSGSSFQGFHADYILVIFDEATGIPADVWKMVQGLLTSGKVVKFVAIGNPTTRNCEFFKCFSDPSFKKIYLSCFDSPNMIANGFTDMDSLNEEIRVLKAMSDDERIIRMNAYKVEVSYLLSASWVMGRALAWGVDHPLFLSKVLGKFPNEEDNVIIQLGQVEEAQRRTQPTHAGLHRAVGVDVARFGDDAIVFTEIIGLQQTRRKSMHKKSNVEVCDELTAWLYDKFGDFDTTIAIDGTGVGGGVIDILRDRQANNLIPRGWQILEVHFGAGVEQDKDTDPMDNTKEKEKAFKLRFANLKAKMFYELGEDLKKDLAILDDNCYVEQLPTIKYRFQSNGRMLIESKDEYKERTGMNSPDDADSLALANYARHERDSVGTFTAQKSSALTKGATRRDTMRTQEKRIKKRNEY